ncbi:MAG TPA: amino acid adenylation domain-containing protein [Pyrinomonadaceae bacterium]|nr:amino acid adenylation domain-containing protein [Pyrinomonadaceae bacterium]
MTDNPSTFIELLRQRARTRPDGVAYVFLADGEREEHTLTYGELDRQARAIAARLRSEGEAGERVLLLYPPGLDYVAAFFGCLYAGMPAVPVYPPRPNRTLPRLQAITEDAAARLALTTRGVLDRTSSLLAEDARLGSLRWLATDETPGELADRWQAPASDGSALAYLQYTSGSTSTPKGVMVSHSNLLYNSADMDDGWRHDADSVIVSWLPHFHDMGLIYGILQPLYKGIRGVLMPPAAFLQQPSRWLDAITRHGGTHSAAPNFAYELCVRKVTAEERADLDLGRWAVAVNGAEPVRRETMERFAEAFAPAGFRRSAFCPGYGLAEATLKVSASRRAEEPAYCSVETQALARNLAVEAGEESAGAQTLVGCGRAALATTVAIINPETSRACGPGEVGEIWVAGPSVAQGYWNRPEETERVFGAHAEGAGGPHLRTGDLGFLRGGELFVTGRLKDLIIIRGRNHYPQDIELTAEQSHPALRPGCGAAFSVEQEGAESLVVVLEVERSARPETAAEIVEAVRRAVAAEHELHAYGVVLIKTGSLPKTSSGKVQRAATRAAFLSGNLAVFAESVLRESAEETPEPSLTRAALLALDAAERREALAAYLLGQTARQLRTQAAALDPARPPSAFGLDSLMAVELGNRLGRDLGVEVSPATLLGDASLAELSESLLEQLTTAAATPSPVTKGDADAGALSYGQRALWFTYQLDRESAAYNVMYAARAPRSLDAGRLRHAWQVLSEQHAALRATYSERGGEPRQSQGGRASAWFEETDASGKGEAEMSALLTAEGERPFDLEAGPVARLQLFRGAERGDYLLLSIHHIACDFWSLDVLAAELSQLYLDGRDRPDRRPEAGYEDFVRWQAEMLRGPRGGELWDYWRGQLSGELPALNLPTDRPRPSVQTYRGSTQSFTLDGALTRRLKALARAEGCTPFMTLLAAFQVLLSRYTGQDDILVGSPTTGRSRPEFADVVGYFVNPVVLRARLSGDPTFRSFLGQVRRTVLSALAHQDYPVALLSERLQPVRDPSRSPLFQVTFAWDKLQRLSGESGALETLFWKQGGAPFDLMMSVLESGESLVVHLHYNSDLFDDETVARFGTHYRTLLEGIADEPGGHVSALPLLSAPERRQLLVEWNETRVEFGERATAPRQFEARAAATPDAVAVVSGETSITYGELNASANRLARRLKALGVGPEVRVAVCLERSAETVLSALAVSKAGGAYVPLDPSNPKDRLAFMLEDARARVAIAGASVASELGLSGARLVCFEKDWEEISRRESAANLPAEAEADNLAYVIYTSGSTGQPKGVQVSHAALSNLVHWTRHAFGLTSSDRATLLAGVGFDASVWEMWPALTCGASLHLPDDETRTSPGRLRDYLVARGITFTFLPTPLAESVISLTWPAGAALRVMLTGGDQLHRYPPDSLPFALVNNYGPTENAVVATSCLVPPRDDAGAPPPIGRPVANVKLYILDARRQPVPAGVAGELYVGGASLMRGYLNRPALTAEKLVPDPFSLEPGARMYRTGDLGRHLPDGNIEYLGRLDHQVKVRGFRIELGEIEAALSGVEGVRACAVEARGDGPGEKRLVAYVVPDSGCAPTVGEMRAALKERLPEYMVPSAFVTLGELPLTPNGKVDRKALPAPDWDGETAAGHVAPRTPVEEVLAKIWGEVLGRERVGVEENFFERGGHSLLMGQVIARAQETLQVGLSLRAFLEAPTVAGLAGRVEQAARAAGLNVERVAQLWLMVEQLSAAEVEAALHQDSLL